jgi:Fe-S cluster assembly iron-binding protein IscA
VRPAQPTRPAAGPERTGQAAAGLAPAALPDGEEVEPHMMSVTDEAIGFIRRLTDWPGRSADAGMRIAAGPMPGSLRAQVTDRPHDEDQVIDTSGARVFLDAAAAHALDGKTLNASIVDGRVTFITRG